MKPGAGKQKGSNFERVVCKQLSLWWTHEERDDIFWRSSLSGGRATVASKKGQNLAHVSGDICAVHPLGYPFVERYLVSCKFYRDLRLEGAMLGSKGGITQFWQECITEAKKYDKQPILISKQNQTQPFVCLSSQGITDFGVADRILV